MTFREKLADLISGGALNDAQNIADSWKDLYNEMRIECADLERACENMRINEIHRQNRLVERLSVKCNERVAGERKWKKTIECIRDETANIKSGTAQKIHRMAKEALGE